MGKSINSPPNSPKIISGKLTKVKSIPKKTYPPKKKEINPNQAPPQNLSKITSGTFIILILNMAVYPLINPW
jgi:hypothetical protein